MFMRIDAGITLAAFLKGLAKVWWWVGATIAISFVFHPGILVIGLLVAAIPAALIWMHADNLHDRLYPEHSAHLRQRRARKEIGRDSELASRTRSNVGSMTFADYLNWANRRGRSSNQARR